MGNTKVYFVIQIYRNNQLKGLTNQRINKLTNYLMELAMEYSKLRPDSYRYLGTSRLRD